MNPGTARHLFAASPAAFPAGGATVVDGNGLGTGARRDSQGLKQQNAQLGEQFA
jgi:hypothetical protein